MTINPRSLFRSEITEFKIKTTKGAVRYINLDNAATTPPLKYVEETVSKYMESYGSVHRRFCLRNVWIWKMDIHFRLNLFCEFYLQKPTLNADKPYQ